MAILAKLHGHALTPVNSVRAPRKWIHPAGARSRIEWTNHFKGEPSMNISSQFLVIAGALALAASANASTTTMSDTARITNGGTGYVGLTQSVAEPHSRWARGSNYGIPNSAGEASTMVDGRPNVDINAPKSVATRMRPADLRAMGSSHSMAGEADVATPATH
jgi:hypothetical protein